MTVQALRARWRLLIAAGLAALVAAVLSLATVAPPDAQAATWRTKLSRSGGGDDYSRTFGPTKAKLWRGRATRLRYWTARYWDADDREWEYDWVRFRLIRADTGKVVKTFGPYKRPTGVNKWRSVSITLPKGGHRYKLRAIADDARFGFRLQQRH